jgi:hypothetical protein
MIWIYTFWVIAFMPDNHSMWDFAKFLSIHPTGDQPFFVAPGKSWVAVLI